MTAMKVNSASDDISEFFLGAIKHREREEISYFLPSSPKNISQKVLDEALQIASERGDEDTVKQLLKSDANPHTVNLPEVISHPWLSETQKILRKAREKK